MHRIDGAGNVGGMFDPGNPGITEATVLTPDWCNAVQEELVHVILTQAGISLVKGTNTQLWAALVALLGRLGTANTWEGVQTLEAGITTPAVAAEGLQILASLPIFDGAAYAARIYAVEATHTQFSDGGLLLTWNASWDGSAWQPDVSGQPAQAMFVRRDGNIRLHRIASLSSPAGAAAFDGVVTHMEDRGMRVATYVSTASGPHNGVTAFEGRVAIKAGTDSITINNSNFTTGSIPLITYQSGAVRDSTLTEIWCDMLSGSLVIYGNANATSDVLVAWRVMVPPA